MLFPSEFSRQSSCKISVIYARFSNWLYYMQRIWVCIMLCCLAFECAGICIIQAIDLYGNKDTMRELVKEELSRPHSAHAIEIIRFSDYDFAGIMWLDGGKEFRRNGIMYDVIRMWHEKDSVAIECFRDEKETEILDSIAGSKERSGNAAQSSDGNSIFSKTFAKYLRPNSTTETIESLIAICFSGYLYPEVKSNSPEVPTPPPRLT